MAVFVLEAKGKFDVSEFQPPKNLAPKFVSLVQKKKKENCKGGLKHCGLMEDVLNQITYVHIAEFQDPPGLASAEVHLIY